MIGPASSSGFALAWREELAGAVALEGSCQRLRKTERDEWSSPGRNRRTRGSASLGHRVETRGERSGQTRKRWRRAPQSSGQTVSPPLTRGEHVADLPHSCIRPVSVPIAQIAGGAVGGETVQVASGLRPDPVQQPGPRILAERNLEPRAPCRSVPWGSHGVGVSY